MLLPEDFSLIINIVVVAGLVLSVILGYTKGFLWELLKIIGVVVILVVGWFLSPGLADLIKIFPEKYIPFETSSISALFYSKINAVCWFIIIFLVGLIILLIIKPIFKFVTELPFIKSFNGIFGALISATKFVIVCLIVSFVLSTPIFANGKEIVEKSFLKYTNVVVEKVSSSISTAFKENAAIQKMLSNPLSLTTEDLKSIVNWMKQQQISGEDIYNFLKNYGIDVNKINEIINSIGD